LTLQNVNVKKRSL